MKTLFVFLLLVLGCSELASGTAPDYQLLSAEKFSKHTRAKLILVRNDTLQAVEVGRADIGSMLICITQKGRVVVQPIKTSTFKEKDHALVRCRYGKFHFSNASIWSKKTSCKCSSFSYYFYLPATILERTLSWVLRCLSSFGRRISSRPCFSWASASSITTSSGSTRVRVNPPQNSSRWK